MAKVSDFESLHGSKCDVQMELCLKKYQRKQSLGELISANQSTGLQEQLHLDIYSGFNDSYCNDIVAPAAVGGMLVTMGLRVVYNCQLQLFLSLNHVR